MNLFEIYYSANQMNLNNEFQNKYIEFIWLKLPKIRISK